MDFSAPHAGFVIAAYAISAIFLAGLVIRVVIRDLALRAEAETIDARRHRTQS